MPTDELRRLDPFAVEFRYNDEVMAKIARDELNRLLTTLLDWAQLVAAEAEAISAKPEKLIVPVNEILAEFVMKQAAFPLQ